MIEASSNRKDKEFETVTYPVSPPIFFFFTMLALYSFQKSESQDQRDGFMVKKLKEIWNKDPTVHVGTAAYL